MQKYVLNLHLIVEELHGQFCKAQNFICCTFCLTVVSDMMLLMMMMMMSMLIQVRVTMVICCYGDT